MLIKGFPRAFQGIHTECTMQTVPGLLAQLDSLQMNCVEAANSLYLTDVTDKNIKS